VTNAYLLCRIVDTIEDEATLSAPEKRRFCTQFASVVAGETPPAMFASQFGPCLSSATPPAEKELIRHTPRVIAKTLSFNHAQQDALRECVSVMADGMAAFQEARTGLGLANVAEVDRYCYYVAGVVGEMLTRLFCDYSQEIDGRRDSLMQLAVSFGQGLQMTNILKDIWEDRRRGACWLPQDVFRRHGYDLARLAPGANDEHFQGGLTEMIGIAHAHLRNALEYTLLIPRKEAQIRDFCLWAIGMAVLTLRKIARNPTFTEGTQVKISRRSVKLVVGMSRVFVRSDGMLKLLFNIASRGLPLAPASYGYTRR
jgi:farnesyl-diphosphate farnesyltransferase